MTLAYRTHSGVSDVSNLTDVGGLLMFSATDGVRGQELWVVAEGD